MGQLGVPVISISPIGAILGGSALATIGGIIGGSIQGIYREYYTIDFSNLSKEEKRKRIKKYFEVYNARN